MDDNWKYTREEIRILDDCRNIKGFFEATQSMKRLLLNPCINRLNRWIVDLWVVRVVLVKWNQEEEGFYRPRLKTTALRKKRDWRVLPPYDRPINSFRIPRNREVHPRPASFSRTLSSRPLALHRLLIRYWTSLEHSALRIYQPFSVQLPPVSSSFFSPSS